MSVPKGSTKFQMDPGDAWWLHLLLSQLLIDPQHCDECARWGDHKASLLDQVRDYLAVITLEAYTNEADKRAAWHQPELPWLEAEVRLESSRDGGDPEHDGRTGYFPR
jgi:hypothetical protein